MLGSIFNKDADKKEGPSDKEVEEFCEAIGGQYPTVERLLDKYGAALVARTRDSGLMLRATRNGDLYIMEPLLKNGFDINEKDGSGRTVLSVKAGTNCQVSKELLKKGRSTDTWGVISWLLKNGARIDDRDNDGWTPLMHAAAVLNKRTVELLLENGADMSAKSKDGKTVLMVVGEHKDRIIGDSEKEIIDLLEHYAEVQAELEGQRKAAQREQWLDATNCGKGLDKPLRVSGPLGAPKMRK